MLPVAVFRASIHTVYPKKYAHGYCFAVLCCGYTLTDFPISIWLTSLALWQSNDCPIASKATLMNMDKYFMWIHYERLHNHNKVKHNKTVCIFLGIYCIERITFITLANRSKHPHAKNNCCSSCSKITIFWWISSICIILSYRIAVMMVNMNCTAPTNAYWSFRWVNAKWRNSIANELELLLSCTNPSI